MVGRVRSWLSDEIFRRLLTNAGMLLGSHTFTSLIGLITLALTARILGPEQFGVLVLMQTYVAFVTGLVNFQSWQAIIKFGADALEAKNESAFKQLIRFGFTLDAATAVVGCLIAVAGAPLIVSWFGWGSEMIPLVVILGLLSVFNLTSTPLAIVRLFNRFGLLVAQRVVSSLLNLILIVGAYLLQASLLTLVIIWGSVTAFGHLLLLWLAIRELRGRRLFELRLPLRGVTTAFPKLWAYVWTTNLNASIRMTVKEMDVLIVGSILGSAATGLYAVAKRFASKLTRFSDPLYQAIYPELARLSASANYQAFVQVMLRGASVAGAMAMTAWLIFAIFGHWILSVTVGADFVEAYAVLLWYMFAIVLAVVTFPLQPAMLALGRPQLSFWIHTASTMVYFPFLLAAVFYWGLVGAGVAYVAYYVTWCTAMTAAEIRILKPLAPRVQPGDIV